MTTATQKIEDWLRRKKYTAAGIKDTIWSMIMKEYSLGRQTVAYDPGAKSLTVFGGGYRFYPDGTVRKT